jgi:uncharacterized protein YdcH (DUF465 family)
MDSNDATVKQLLENDGEFRKLHEEHLKYEEQLKELDKIHYLTPEQELQRKTIQKLKLSGKDRMSRMVRQARPE